MRRIVFTVTNDLTYDQRMQKICTSLTEHGFSVKLVGRNLKHSIPLEKKTYSQKRLLCFFTKGKMFYLEYNLRLFIYLLFQPADIYSAIDLDTILPNLFVSRLKRKKVVYDAHEYFTEVPEVTNRRLVKKIWQWVEAFSIPKMDACYTVSESIGELFFSLYKKKFEIIRNVPYLEHVVEVAPPEKFILYQGALNKGRGLEELIEAMKELPMKLKIAGEGDLSDALRNKVRELNLGDRVEFCGYIHPKELKELTQHAWLGYNLLENLGLSYYYSLSNKFFDYIHALVPAISPPFPEYEKINCEYKVNLLTNLSVSSIVYTVSELSNNPGLYEEMKQNCLHAREVFHWKTEELKLISIYKNL